MTPRSNWPPYVFTLPKLAPTEKSLDTTVIHPSLAYRNIFCPLVSSSLRLPSLSAKEAQRGCLRRPPAQPDQRQPHQPARVLQHHLTTGHHGHHPRISGGSGWLGRLHHQHHQQHVCVCLCVLLSGERGLEFFSWVDRDLLILQIWVEGLLVEDRHSSQQPAA